jgi:hypothetical protein
MEVGEPEAEREGRQEPDRSEVDGGRMGEDETPHPPAEVG